MANTLFEYFKSLGQNLPSVQERAKTYGLGADYKGDVEQNNQLLARLQSQPKTTTTAAVPPTQAPTTTPPPVTTPSYTQTAPNVDQEKYLKSYVSNLAPTAEENNTQNELTTLEGATRQGVVGLEGRGLGIPLTLVRGQQAKLQQQGELGQQTLRQKLANLQAQRKSAIDVSKFELERVDSAAKTASDRAYEAQKTALAEQRKDAAPYTLSQGQTRYDAQGNVLSSVAPKATAASTKAASTGKTIKSGGLVYSPQAAAEDSQALEASRGSDNYVDPTVYQNLYKAWIAGGGTQKDFLLTYPPKGYVNPANTWLPSYLMPAKTKSAASSGREV